jgi:phage terminase large subunit
MDTTESRSNPSRAFGTWYTEPHQDKLWKYLAAGGKRACAVHHRRSGKDEVSLRWTYRAAHQRVGNYWHMLPQAEQARKAIWDAINPHTGVRRIDEAFPLYARRRTRNNEMMIEFLNGSIWQVVGSDNYNALVGSPPVGIVFSEWALADPHAWAYMRPILKENGGWAIFIYTPRGRNHGLKLYQAAKKTPGWFHEILPADQTGVFTAAELAEELAEYIEEYGPEHGKSFYEQEYECSFDAAILGSIYAAWIRKLENKGAICSVPHDPRLPVHTAWDVGFKDDTTIWFWQITLGEIRLLDFYTNHGKDTLHYCEQLVGRKILLGVDGKPLKKADSKGDLQPVYGDAIPDANHRLAYTYGRHWVPHDAAHELMAAGGRSIVNQAWDAGIEMSVIPATSQMNSIAAARKTLDRCFFDATRCERGIDALRSYQYEWDKNKRAFKDEPFHNWASHGSDAFEIIGQVWQTPESEKPKPQPRFLNDMTAKELFALDRPVAFPRKYDRI